MGTSSTPWEASIGSVYPVAATTIPQCLPVVGPGTPAAPMTRGTPTERAQTPPSGGAAEGPVSSRWHSREALGGATHRRGRTWLQNDVMKLDRKPTGLDSARRWAAWRSFGRALVLFRYDHPEQNGYLHGLRSIYDSPPQLLRPHLDATQV